MLVSWRWRLVVAVVGLVLFLSPSGVAAKIERFKDNEGTLHISNTGEEPVKPGGATTPKLPSPPTPPQPMPPAPLPRPVPPPEQVPPPPPDDQGEAPPIMDPGPNEPQPEPPVEQPASEAGNDRAGHQAQAEPNAGSGQPETAQPPIRKIPGPGGRGRGALAR
jgi:hypothetical protein